MLLIWFDLILCWFDIMFLAASHLHQPTHNPLLFKQYPAKLLKISHNALVKCSKFLGFISHDCQQPYTKYLDYWHNSNALWEVCKSCIKSPILHHSEFSFTLSLFAVYYIISLLYFEFCGIRSDVKMVKITLFRIFRAHIKYYCYSSWLTSDWSDYWLIDWSINPCINQPINLSVIQFTSQWVC